MITMTTQAVEQFRTLLAKHEKPSDTALRVGIKGGGCSGYSYVFDFEEKPPGKKDQTFEFEGMTLIIDKKSALFLAGTEIDYETSYMKEGFVFKNPQAKSTCGCGLSFGM